MQNTSQYSFDAIVSPHAMLKFKSLHPPKKYMHGYVMFVPDKSMLQVQCGFGRVGSHFWGFELQQVVPDLVTLGKPIGNGFPMGGVITSPQLAKGFSNGMEYFNTCGGCTAAAAAGLW